ncbi:tetratricopeptide repeat protein [Marinobacter salarius]|uniref:tetratricopeptide repeat protein n=1 Tax=Marinobacter salarius TaxID=1420917 RepID=UPI001D18FD34|nr:tetratricopeptide repeat protein [Marinobacter salarius]MCC4285915.1 tetratricopeptide repeat protein [Marinobacter salarius]
MSLLNDALRAAEQRQDRPVAPGVYAGGQAQAGNRKRALVSVLVVLAIVVAGLGGYWLLSIDSSSAPAELASVPSTDTAPSADEPSQAKVSDVAADVSRAEPEEPAEAVKAVSSPAMAEPEPVQIQASTPRTPASQNPAPEPLSPETTEPDTTEQEPAQSPPASVAKREKVEPSPTEPEKEKEKEAETEAKETEPEQTAMADVKQVPETPAATDRSTARELEKLVAQGRITDAERRLAALTREQDAPRSRYVVARALLVDGKQDQALGWLPAEVTAQNTALRLLRARALHANNDLGAALNTLTSSIPPVEGHAEYRVTLATLLQQQGDSAEAARHWAALIAWDDSQAPWWVGLAISLETQGEQAGAARAYQQAAELPGLPRSLADYVQQRLQALRAG